MNKTHEDYVSFEQAKALKELSFNSKCICWYHPEHPVKFFEGAAYCNHNYFNRPYSAPTLAQVQKWLRELREIEVCAHADFEGGFPNGKWLFYLRKLSDCVLDTDFDYEQYNSYEQALSAGIDKAIEILKQQNL